MVTIKYSLIAVSINDVGILMPCVIIQGWNETCITRWVEEVTHSKEEVIIRSFCSINILLNDIELQIPFFKKEIGLPTQMFQVREFSQSTSLTLYLLNTEWLF